MGNVQYHCDDNHALQLFGGSADAVCGATSAGVSVSLTSAVGAAKVLTVTLSAASAAGSELVITCTGNLAVNAAAGRTIRIASLAVGKADGNVHETVYGVPSYT